MDSEKRIVALKLKTNSKGVPEIEQESTTATTAVDSSPSLEENANSEA